MIFLVVKLKKKQHLRPDNLGYLLARAMQSWNRVLYEAFCHAGFEEVRPSYGSILIPLYEEDGLRMGELARRSGLSKQTITTLIRNMEKKRLVRRQRDPDDARATRIYLTRRCREFESIAEHLLADMDKAAALLLDPAEVSVLKAYLKKLQKLGG